jgi:hypothetical protein
MARPGVILGLVLIGALASAVGCAPSQSAQSVHSASASVPPSSEHFVAGGFIPVTEADAVLGSSAALITIVAFFDLESDKAASWDARARRTLDRVMQRYGPAVRVVLKHYPLYLHPHARKAAIASQVVLENLGPQWFFSFTKRVMDNEYGADDEFLEKAATEIGLPVDVYRRGLLDKRHERKVDADVVLAKHIGEGLAAPLFAVNGVISNGPRPFEWFSGVIGQELGPARALQVAGLSPGQVYERRVAENLANPPRHHHYHPNEEIRTDLGLRTPSSG